MNVRRYPLPAFGLILLALVLSCTPERGPDRRPKFSALRELSGLCVSEDGKNLYGVSDEGRLAEFEPSGRIIRDAYFGDEDLEGITRAPNGELWLIEERRSRVIRIDPETFERKGDFKVETYPERKDKNSGYEGIQIGELDRLWLLNQKPAALVCFEMVDGRPLRREAVALPIENANDFLILAEDRGFVVLCKRQGLRLFNRLGRPLGSWFELTDEDFEGLTLLADRGLFLCADDNPSSIMALEDIKDEEALIKMLSDP